MTKGELEDKISKSLTQWEKDYLGRGSILVKTDILRNMVIVLMRGILTAAEQELATTREGLMSVKRMRSDLVESGANQLKALVSELTGIEVMSFYTDISTQTGERVMVFIMKSPIE
ncbi:DUF2294 domain-containing protein [Alicyclobacillus ferrooxydans]|uniref:Na+-translocating membrane potential-generating system MpsC domain-containing protein n=1 Tax=Alicyclobacillus ferrooxydans TaxID=471514 RepID=A0A0P9EHK2_9BACL|nr:DUF2294 domain-containing protein [Alicyclobacillus ferrooxydans]KPV42116.1 hypothetical protein AN477_18865 [Alicyclobacillus ferrooxydans]